MKIDDLIKLLTKAKEEGIIEVKIIRNYQRKDIELFKWSILKDCDVLTQLCIGCKNDHHHDIK